MLKLKGIKIGGEIYYEAKEVVGAVGVSRQTLWTWRKEQLIPLGSKYRNRVVFSEREVSAIEAHAARIEPVALRDTKSQLRLKLT